MRTSAGDKLIELTTALNEMSLNGATKQIMLTAAEAQMAEVLEAKFTLVRGLKKACKNDALDPADPIDAKLLDIINRF